jgi:hypothetical protein
MVLDRRDRVGCEIGCRSQRAELTVARVPSGTPGDLRQLAVVVRTRSASSYTSSIENATMAVRAGSAPSVVEPAYVSCENRALRSIRAVGSSSSMVWRIDSAPRNHVSRVPRACSNRSVNVCPRWGCAASWISSTATNSTSRSTGIDSTVLTQ